MITALTTLLAAADQQQQLFRDLLEAPTAVKRFQRLLVNNRSLFTGDALRKLTVFDFNNAQPAKGAKGSAAKAADVDTFPILTGLDISVTVSILEPCGINTPHVHPRATKILTLIKGLNLRFGYILKNSLVKPG
ncbi:hypothetical protein EKO04_011608 [Ascochyta lentis]|uniref:Cupin type-1 domain-containing protein n=1 Tax=Ascochyta lentis TaxID=205686 RepID=A0A8H7MBA9_9PLEO|nr:hypothetical protein EKO04_011608 [Ascochyta lentis]